MVYIYIMEEGRTVNPVFLEPVAPVISEEEYNKNGNHTKTGIEQIDRIPHDDLTKHQDSDGINSWTHEHELGEGFKDAPDLLSEGKNRYFTLLITAMHRGPKTRVCELLWFPLLESGDRRIKGQILLKKVEKDPNNPYKLTFWGQKSNSRWKRTIKRVVTFSENKVTREKQMKNIGIIYDNCDFVVKENLMNNNDIPMAEEVGGRKTRKRKLRKGKSKRKTGRKSKKKTLIKRNKQKHNKKLRTRRRR